MLPLYLASSSLRRQRLLSQLGLPFTVIIPQVSAESTPVGSYSVIARVICQNALQKAISVTSLLEEGLVLSGDTLIVTKDGEALGKPGTPQRAIAMLRQLVGTWHRVVSAVAIVDVATKNNKVAYTSARVWFRAVPDAALRRYVATGEPLDKAGGYGIQDRGSFLVKRVTGSYTAVVGFPLELVVNLLEVFGIKIWNKWETQSFGSS